MTTAGNNSSKRQFSTTGAFLCRKDGVIEKKVVILQFTKNYWTEMTTGNIIRFACVLVLWLALCCILLTSVKRIDFNVVFTIVASGIIVFVPLYKKYVRKKD